MPGIATRTGCRVRPDSARSMVQNSQAQMAKAGGQLCQTSKSELVLRYFELQLLNEVGYRPQLQHCVTCHQPLKPVINSFCSSAGGVLCPDCYQHQPLSRPISVNALKVLRLLQNSDYGTVSRLAQDQELSRELEAITRDYLKYHLEREIKSAAWLDTLRVSRTTNNL